MTAPGVGTSTSDSDAQAAAAAAAALQQQHFSTTTNEPSSLDLDMKPSLFDLQFTNNDSTSQNDASSQNLVNLVEFAASQNNDHHHDLQFVNKRGVDDGYQNCNHPDPEAMAEISRAFSIDGTHSNTYTHSNSRSPSQSSFQVSHLSTPDLN